MLVLKLLLHLSESSIPDFSAEWKMSRALAYIISAKQAARCHSTAPHSSCEELEKFRDYNLRRCDQHLLYSKSRKVHVGLRALHITGRLAQLVERPLSMREAGGSIPPVSMNFLNRFSVL